MTSAPTHSPTTTTHASEIAHKLTLIREALDETGAKGIRLRGTDWFSWATAGASHTVLLAAESGVAEILVTAEGAWLITNEIEAQRFKDEELPGRGESAGGYTLYTHPWADADAPKAFVQEVTGGGNILSDKPSTASPASNEGPLPSSLMAQKRVMLPSELERYREVGRLAGEAMTEVLLAAQPTWTEYQLAGAGAEAMWARGIHPALTLAAGERRLPLYRHPIPTGDSLGRVAMLVFCARKYGLVASLTRFVYFGSLSSEEETLHRQVREVEAAALDASQPGTSLNAIYETIAQAYTQQGYPNAIREHHQGGPAGYLSREMIATPTATATLAANMVVAWNPSLPGAKVEDTFAIAADGKLENLTLDPHWQTVEVSGRARPLPLVR